MGDCTPAAPVALSKSFIAPAAFETRGVKAFRERYPKGKNYVLSPLSGPAYEQLQDGLKLAFVSPGYLRQAFA